MNAAVRAVVRSANAQGLEVLGFQHGYTGMLDGDFRILDRRAVGGIVDRGGTVLGSSRCERLKTPAGIATATAQLSSYGLQALIVIGGNGSHAGACSLSQAGVPVIAIASTIDNDLPTCDVTIGATTAVDTALQAIDRLRVTASAHGRVFLVEVMGRNSGHLALWAGVAGGAEAIVVPEIELTAEDVAAQIVRAYDSGKSHAIVVVAEGARNNADALARHFTAHHQRLGFELRVTKLGHIQRGGSPGAYDRIMASRLGAAAIDHLMAKEAGITLGLVNGQIAPRPLSEAVGHTKPLDQQLWRLAESLSR